MRKILSAPRADQRSHQCTTNAGGGPLHPSIRPEALAAGYLGGVIIAHEAWLGKQPRNALWELFSFQAEKIIQGAKDYHWCQRDHVPILDQTYHRYRELGIDMPYTFDDIRHDLALELVDELPREERLCGLSPEELARRLSPEDRLLGLNPEQLARLRELLNAGKTGKG